MQRTQMCHTNRRFQHRNRTRSLNQENGPLFELIKTTLTIIQNLQVKKEQGFIGQHSMGTNRRQQTRTSSHLSVDKWKVSNDLIPNYRIFSVQTFKNILCQAIPHYRQQLEQYLNDSRLLSFIQQYTHLFCIFYQLELEKDYWKNINDKLLFAMNWLRKMSKDLTKRYLLDWNYPRTEKNLRHRQRSLENKIASTTRELQIHLQQYAPFYIEWNPALMQQTLPIILQATMTLIKIDLQRFETNFVHRKLLMQYDANNVELLKSFYDAHPSEQDKLIFQKLWCMQHKSGRRVIRQEEQMNTAFLTMNKMSYDIQMISNPIVPINAANIHQLHQSYLHGLLSPRIRNIIEAHQQNIIHRIEQILLFKK